MGLENAADSTAHSKTTDFFGQNFDRSTLLGKTEPQKVVERFEKLFGGFELPPLAEKVEWSHDLFASFKTAIAEHRPLIVEFSQEGCEWCRKLNQEMSDQHVMDKYSEQAVFCRVDPEKDEDSAGNVYALAKNLNLTRYPTTVVLDVSDNLIKERGRIVGYVPGSQFAEQMDKLLPQKSGANTEVASLNRSTAAA